MKRFGASIVAALVALVVIINVIPANAATSSGLSITPRKDLTIEPGKTVSDKLTVGNLDAQKDLVITVRVVDFTFMNESGIPKLLLAQNAPQTPWSLKPFTKLPKSVTVPAGATKRIPYSISIPKNQGAGSYYSAIVYSAASPNGSNVSLGASGVSLVFVTVPGTVHEKLTLTKFGAFQPEEKGVGGSYVWISLNMPQQLAYTLKNEGNVAEAPVGSIKITDFFGHTVKTLENINVNQTLALIGQTRRFDTCIESTEKKVEFENQDTTTRKCVDPHLKPGYYTIELDAFYGFNGNKTQEVTGTAHFWYLPWWFIIAVLVGLALIVYVIRRFYKKIKSLKRRANRRR